MPFVDHEVGYRLLEKMIACSPKFKFDIPAVVTTQDNANSWWPKVETICNKEKIPLHIYEDDFRTDLFTVQPDWILLLSWKYLLPNIFIGIPKIGILNLHYSLLPEFRGVYPVNWSIIEGKRSTGITFHFVTDEIDGGDVFMQFDAPIFPSDTARTLQLRLDDIACNCFDEFLDQLMKFNGVKPVARNQTSAEEKKDYYSRRRFQEVCVINPEANYRGADLLNLLRGLTFFPDTKNAYFFDKDSGKKLFISINLHED